MKHNLLSAALTLLAAVSCTTAIPNENQAQTGDRYFGIHCDFHATPAPGKVIGATTREDDIREICRALRPDFIQVDTKGHPGWVSYPTEIGNAMPVIEGDPLALWRKVTKEEGVALYSHYSGVWDSRYIQENPSEGCLHADGSRSPNATRTAGKYVDEVLIPQLMELAGKYGMDGIWVDGDCWGTEVDFDPRTVKMFEEETGIQLDGKLPANRGDAYYDEYRDFCRELFRKYLRHYVDTVHERYPDYKIASNWSFTDHMPEPVTADVDYLSGDFTSEDSYAWARYSARAIEKQGIPWDLMAWGFRLPHTSGTYLPKHPVQLMQEAAAVISLGGGFQIYIPQFPDGRPDLEKLKALAPVSEFVKARKAWAFGGHLKPQVAVLLSTENRHKTAYGLFSRDGSDSVVGLINLLCDAGHSVSIVSEHDLAGGKISDYPVIVVPELESGLAPESFSMFKSYVENGGSLFVSGKHSCQLFAENGFPCAPEPAGTHDGSAPVMYETDCAGSAFSSFPEYDTCGCSMGRMSNWAALATTDGQVMARLRNEDTALAAVRELGEGKLAAIPADISRNYSNEAQYQLVRLVKKILEALYIPEIQILQSKGKLEVDYLVKDGKPFIQLSNSGGNHHFKASLTEDSLAPVCDIVLSYRAAGKPKAFILQPEGQKLDFDWSDGQALVTVPRIDIHSAIQVIE